MAGGCWRSAAAGRWRCSASGMARRCCPLALVPEWLGALSSAGRRAPAALLPDLLELGRTQADLRAAILPALDRRGGWLAAQNPDWSYASNEFSVTSDESPSLITRHSSLVTQ